MSEASHHQQGSQAPEQPLEEPVVGRAPPEAGTRYSAREIHNTSTEERSQRALAAAGYPLGFIIVVLSGTQLFTENTLEPILRLLERPSRRMLAGVGRLWGILFTGNQLGTPLFAAVLARTSLSAGWLRAGLNQVSQAAISGGFAQTLFLGIFGGWLIALMAWLINTTQDLFAQIVLIWLTTAPISAFGFRHSIAGSVETYHRAFQGATSWEKQSAVSLYRPFWETPSEESSWWRSSFMGGFAPTSRPAAIVPRQ